jgi:hypothetical protein
MVCENCGEYTKSIWLGSFYNFEDAREARYRAEDEYYGEYASRHSRPPFKYDGPQFF